MVQHPNLKDIKLNALVRTTTNTAATLSPDRIPHYVYTVTEHVERTPPSAPVPKARAIDATLAALNGLSADQIVAHGNWSSRSIFEDFYRISVSNNTNFTIFTLEVPQVPAQSAISCKYAILRSIQNITRELGTLWSHPPLPSQIFKNTKKSQKIFR